MDYYNEIRTFAFVFARQSLWQIHGMNDFFHVSDPLFDFLLVCGEMGGYKQEGGTEKHETSGHSTFCPKCASRPHRQTGVLRNRHVPY